VMVGAEVDVIPALEVEEWTKIQKQKEFETYCCGLGWAWDLGQEEVVVVELLLNTKGLVQGEVLQLERVKNSFLLSNLAHLALWLCAVAFVFARDFELVYMPPLDKDVGDEHAPPNN
jgi:hypothetical protein